MTQVFSKETDWQLETWSGNRITLINRHAADTHCITHWSVNHMSNNMCDCGRTAGDTLHGTKLFHVSELQKQVHQLPLTVCVCVWGAVILFNASQSYTYVMM